MWLIERQLMFKRNILQSIKYSLQPLVEMKAISTMFCLLSRTLQLTLTGFMNPAGERDPRNGNNKQTNKLTN
jgi:hypothetical protein